MKTPTPLPEEWSKEFDKKFPCVEDGCDNNGTISRYDRDGDQEVRQCQWCFEKRLPIKDFIRSLLHQSYEQGKRDALKEAIALFDKHKEDVMTGNVVNLELKVMLDALNEGKKDAKV